MERNDAVITIGGREWPMNFSLRAAKSMSERYGGLENIMTPFQGDDVVQMLEEFAWMMSVLVQEGVARKNILEGSRDEGISQEDIMVLMNVGDLEGIKAQLLDAITGGMARTVETEREDGGKNAPATRRKASSRGASTTG